MAQQGNDFLLVAGADRAKMFFRLTRNALIGKAAVINTAAVAVLGQVVVLEIGEPGAKIDQGGFPLLAGSRRTGLFAPAFFRGFGVEAFEELLRITGDAVERPFAEHDVSVRLIAQTDSGLRIVDSPQIRMLGAKFRYDEMADELNSLFRG